MDMKIRNVPKEIHREFKLQCVKEGVSMNGKLIALIEQTVNRHAKEVASLPRGTAEAVGGVRV